MIKLKNSMGYTRIKQKGKDIDILTSELLTSASACLVAAHKNMQESGIVDTQGAMLDCVKMILEELVDNGVLKGEEDA